MVLRPAGDVEKSFRGCSLLEEAAIERSMADTKVHR